MNIPPAPTTPPPLPHALLAALVSPPSIFFRFGGGRGQQTLKSMLSAIYTVAVVPPKPCNSRMTKRRTALSYTIDDQCRTQGKTGCDNDAYDKLPETANFHVADRYVSFTQTFCYLGSLINYSLRDDDDITVWIASATAAMGALKDIWRNPHLDIYNKYLLFRAIPMNLLLWGAETWSLRKTQLKQLEVFLHRSI